MSNQESKDSQDTGQRTPRRVDRRSLSNRRLAYDLNYFEDEGAERRKIEGRKLKERRWRRFEPRKGWVRVSDWTSAAIGSSLKRVFGNKVYHLKEGE